MLKTLIEINDVRFIVEVDPTIQEGTIRVPSLDKFLGALAQFEPKPAEELPTKRRRGRGHISRAFMAPRGVVQEAMNAGMDHLDEKERKVINGRYGKHPKSVDDLAKSLNTTPYEVSQLTKAALAKLGIDIVKRNVNRSPDAQ